MDVWIEQIPVGTNLGEVARMIHEKAPKQLFQSFGHLRKQLTQGRFLVDAKPEDAETIIQILKLFSIQSIEKKSTFKNTTLTLPTAIILTTLGVLGVGTFLFFFISQPHPSTSLAPPMSKIDQAPTEKPTVQTQNTTSVSTTQNNAQNHANIESLLISTATIYTHDGSGSAFFVSPDGYLISNQHVTKSEKEVDVLTFDKKKYRGKVIRSQDFYDLSLIKIESKNYPPLRLGDATKLHIGDTVWTIGAPHGLEFSVTRGIASYIGRNVGGKSFLQADVAINPGNSGGPMINDQGEVVGINNFIIKQTVGLNFAIPVNYLFSGPSAILSGIVQTVPDTGLMATWRGWENRESETTSTLNPKSDSKSSEMDLFSSRDELSNLSKELKSIEQNLASRQQKLDLEISKLDQKIANTNSQYTNSQTVSEQEKLGKNLQILQIEKIDLEIKKTDDYLGYIKSASNIMQKARQLTVSNPSLDQHYLQELSKLSQSKLESEALKQSKLQQRSTIASKQY